MSLLVAGCATEPADREETVLEDTPDVVDVTAIDDTFRTFEERIAFLEARADAAEAALAASTSDADNAQLWLQSLTDDVSALQSHASDTDAIVVTTAADLDTLQAAHDAHAQESTAQHAEHDARFDSLDDEPFEAGQAPYEVGRARFGRIAIANSDAAGRAYADAAVDMGYRAVGEVLAG
ncbi:MAG: hypothetical protein GY812_16905 [Actinomycetia bacterium]|nr:hypothetical protein [Actinomycetes bacterium]